MANPDNLTKWGNARQNKADRASHDYYPTPRCATMVLLEKVSFAGEIWEPACGDGAITSVLRERGHSVVESDLRDDPSITGQRGVDFLTTQKQVPNIITNPPFTLASDFIEHALDCVTGKVAMLLRMNFLGSEKRFHLFKKTPLSKVIVISNRLPFFIGGKWIETGAQFYHSWYVWDKENYQGQTLIDWALWD